MAQPNIIFIMSDDHAAHAISSYTRRLDGRAVINQTPNIDRLADEGVILDNCFCTNSICTPSRAVILTGKYSHLTGVTTLATHLDNSQETVAKILQRNKYQTAMVGKWHLGVKPENEPKGFDYWCILPGQGKYHDPDMIEMGNKCVKRGYTTDIITDLSLNWIKERDPNKPFFLMCHHKAPHRPWVPDEKHKDLYKDVDIPIPFTFNDDYSNRASAAAHANMRIENALYPVDVKTKARPTKKYQPMKPPKNIGKYKLKTCEGEKVKFSSQQELKEWKYQRYIKDYLRCIASIDDNIGRMLDYLDANNLSENTIVIYTSDQGFFLGDHGWYDKRFMYEESLRMPFLIRYPKEIPKKSINTDMILNLDFASLFLDYAGIPIPPEMQGKSFRSNLKGNQVENWRNSFYYRYWVNGTYHKVYAHYGVRTHQYKLIYYYCDPLGEKGARSDPHAPEWELFDLQNDPFEMNNVYNDPSYLSIVKELTQELHRLQADVGDTPYTK